MHAGELADACDAEAGSAESRCEGGRELDVEQRHIVLQRRVAEEHVEKLARLEASRFGGQSNRGIECTAVRGHDLDDTRDNLIQNARVTDCFDRQLDALLERNCLCARVDRGRRGADTIRRFDPARVD